MILYGSEVNALESNEFTQWSQRRAKRREKEKKKRIVILVIAIAVIAVISVLVFNSCSNKVINDGKIIEIDIEQGSSAKTIAQLLKDNGLISSVSGFLHDLEKSDYANSLRYGVYQIARGTDNDGIIKILASGGVDKNSVTVTIPEGFSLERIVERLSQTGFWSEDELYSAAGDNYNYDFLSSVPSNAEIKYKLQGFLFPSTYVFKKDSTPHDIFDTMLKEFQKQIETAAINTDNIFDIVTLASLVEREAKIDSERKTIAGVIMNRVEKGMRLQIDASVVYAISDGMYDVDRVLYKDLEFDSPYNTYMYEGLPVGPICSPGIKSLEAAYKPENNSYLYYRVDSDKNDGSHIFTETFDEHKAAG